MRVVLAGASGLIGVALRDSLRADGHAVTKLVRRPPAGADEARWSPDRGELDPAVLVGSDAVVCLSGVPIAPRRLTDAYKAALLSSRVDSVGTIAAAMAGMDGGPRILVAASAVGYYGDTGDREVDEAGPRGAGFLAGLCEKWEAAAQPAKDAGVRVTHTRTGLVLSRHGGLLKPLRLVVGLGVGGRLGSGRQFMPWISLADVIGAIRFLLEHDVSGPVNVTGPAPVRNAELIATLARLMHRPALVPTPAIALRIVLGEFGRDAVAGQRAVPAKLLGAGFVHEHGDVESALRWALAN